MFPQNFYSKRFLIFVVVTAVTLILRYHESANALAPQDYTTVPEGAQIVECSAGVPLCTATKFVSGLNEPEPKLGTSCAPYNDVYVPPRKLDWLLGMAAVVGALMSFGIGSNDAANSWATSVGSGAIPLVAATLVGGLMEFLGAVALGYGVAKSIKGVAKVGDTCWRCGNCDSEMSVYMVGMFSALCAAGIFLLLCSFTSMPVSTTHAIIGGTVGITLAGQGSRCLNWKFDGGLGGIIASWVISPVASGVIGVIAYYITKYAIVTPPKCLPGNKSIGNGRINALVGMPIIFGLQTFVIVFLILIKSPQVKKSVPMGQKLWISVLCAVFLGIVSAMIMIPLVRRRLPSTLAAQDEASKAETGEANAPGAEKAEESGYHESVLALGSSLETKKEVDYPTAADTSTAAMEASEWDLMSWDERDATYTFRYVLVFVAALEGFAHGSNDTGNATGAFSAVYQTWQEGLNTCGKPQTPVWMMAAAGAFVALGVNVLGWKVIRTIGSNLTSINFHRGFCIEFASTFTVVIATFLGMPVSTTHCQVGAVVFVGVAAFGFKHVKWWLFGVIVLTWVLTLPFAGLIGAALTAGIRVAIRR
ncbi:phosphate transporter [Pseudoscourfieldia marina]|uniref:Phosphate transporter n=1 Tax=Pycnococcus provasolii TaxID=41880 RepID=A0A7S2YWY7_9CHLO|mmetsp:Transcript_27/g.66  ORF Transcript_27/g.66 Transcript_27/m.66 type:complete len:590 (+) Transcript_27:239-2008(+)|eukprot:CAMPEP_0119195610 /NCGR_PEP_ID=MMETSP1316-20130426/6505_1 /TAXON_ID=41880 /ORGANISM="Pycnococcus provasolii, Strain RCC2336" /LENGTH=589 /DNA_ID=CAMNT_0007191137 /DNA_START=195 /DNA_END=1964 /DNA_ORIENTATION=-